jgi:alpha-D-xyloside xylohydrolase
MMRPMVLEFPDDPAVAYLDRQYMLGSDLLVAPVFSDDGQVDYYVPAGRWTNILDGTVVEGPRWVRETHDVFSLPLLAREGSALAVQPDRADTEGDLLAGAHLRLFQPVPGTVSRHTFPRSFAAGAPAVEFVVETSDSQVQVTASDADLEWSVELAGTVYTAQSGVVRAAR